jgi:uncharacterized protein YcbK (DUF882 family)
MWIGSLRPNGCVCKNAAHSVNSLRREEHVSQIRSRRQLLRAAALVMPLAMLPAPSLARVRTPSRLRFYHTHTSEKLDIVYAENGQYLADALDEINHFLRDFRTNDVHPIDPQLLDLLSAVQGRTGSRGQFEVISGFRSPHTNEMLRGRSTGVADKSLHLTGQAIDVRLTDLPTGNLRSAALALRSGGVGYYPASDFVHLDTGRVRFW